MKINFLNWLVFSLILAGLAFPSNNNKKQIYGIWQLLPDKSTDLATWRYRTLTLEIREDGDLLVILQKWRRGDEPFYIDSLSFVPGGESSSAPVATRHWPENWYMGVLAMPDKARKVSGEWKSPGRELETKVDQNMQTSQGEYALETTFHYQVDEKLDLLRVQVQRSTRPSVIDLVFERVEE